MSTMNHSFKNIKGGMSPIWKIYVITQDEKSFHAEDLCESEWHRARSAVDLSVSLGPLHCRPKILDLIEVKLK